MMPYGSDPSTPRSATGPLGREQLSFVAQECRPQVARGGCAASREPFIKPANSHRTSRMRRVEFFLPREAAGRWRGAVVLRHESHSSIPRSATGPLGCDRINLVTPLVMSCSCAASGEPFINPTKRQRTSGMLSAGIFLPREAARRWRGAVVLRHESHSSIPRSATGPLGCDRINLVTPLVMSCSCAASGEPFINPTKRQRTSGMLSAGFFLPREAARRWCWAVVLPHESDSSTPRSATGPQGWAWLRVLAHGGSPQVARGGCAA